MFFKKKTVAEIVAEDRKLISANADAVYKLYLLANGNAELTEKLKDLNETLKYLKPINNDKTIGVDIKISNKIDDLKIELSRPNGDLSRRVNNIISEIMVLLVNRKD